MSADVWRSLPALLAVAGLGGAVLANLGLRRRSAFPGDPLGYAAYVAITGSLAVAGLLFVWLLLRAPLGLFPLVPWLAAAALAWGGRRRADRRAAPEAGVTEVEVTPLERGTRDAGPAPRLARVVFAVVVVAAVLVVVDRALLGDGKLVAAGDEAHLWARKAKAMYLTGGFGAAYRDALGAEASAPHQDYPLLNPLLQACVFTHLGRVAHVENRLPIQLLSVALVLLAASALRRRGGPIVASTLLLLLVTTAEFRAAPRYVMADAMVALGVLAALDAASCALDRQRGARRRLALALAFLVWSKGEGLMLALCVLGGLAIGAWLRARRPRAPAPGFASAAAASPATSREVGGWGWSALLFPVGVALVQAGFNRAHEFRSLVMAGMNGDPIGARLREYAGANLSTYVGALYEHAVADPARMNLLLPALAVAWLLHPRRLAGAFGGAGFAILAAVVGYSLVYLANDAPPNGVIWHTKTSLDRVLFHLLPATAVWLAAAWRELGGGARAGTPGG